MTSKEAIRVLEDNRPSVIFEDKDAQKRMAELCKAIDTAIEALRREIPRNPIVNFVSDCDGARRLNDGWTEDSYLCPVCHSYFGEVYDQGYCCKCGQKIIQKRVRVVEP